MVDIGLCDHSECEKSSICRRFLHKKSSNLVYFKFKNICHKKNDWKWLMEIKQEIVVKEEGENT